MESEPIFKIDLPQIGDELFLAPVHIQAWKETYVGPESGMTEEDVDAMIGHLLYDTDFRKNTIVESLKNPENVLYRVVKNSAGNIVGFLHGSKQESHNELEGIYLLDEAKGFGIGGKLMTEFLNWADQTKPSHLEVFAFNDTALGFYRKYGFIQTERGVQMYNNKFPYVEMVRPASHIDKS